MSLVSIIVPSYNHQSFVLEALDSVFEQEYEDIEIICIDDQSKDQTFDIISKWSETPEVRSRFKKIIVHKNKENLGAHDSINYGISLSSGKWISILNSDDCYTYDRIETLVNEARKSNSQFLFSGVFVIDDKGQRVCNDLLAAEIESAIDLVDCYPDISFALLKKNLAISTGNFFFSRELYDKLGGFKPLKYCHDWEFALRACLYTEPRAVSEPMYFYRFHGSNSFSDLKIEKYFEPNAVYRSYFVNALSGNGARPGYASSYNWPGYYESFVDSDSHLSAVHRMLGGEIPRYDSLGKMINKWIVQDR